MVRIFTDSAADFEPQELAEKQITSVSMKIFSGDAEYRENENLTKEEFYRNLLAGEHFPRTSQPSPADFETALKPAQAEGEEAVVISISSGLSGTYQSACMAKDMLGYENCYVVDTKTGTSGQRALVEYAVKLRDIESAAEIAEAIIRVREKLALYVCLDTMEYLYKGGRISRIAYTAGSFSKIKPIVTINKEGTVSVAAKALGMRRGIQTMCEKLRKNPPNTDYPIYIAYSHERGNAEILAEEIKKLGYSITEEHIVNMGATIGTMREPVPAA